jgi:RHS repeat-associated protein
MSPLQQTDASGSAVWRAELTPYGEIFTYRAGQSSHQPLRLPGQIVIDGSATYYNIFRWYRPAWSRYAQSDPAGVKGDINLSRYVRNNPLAFIDPLGLLTFHKAIQYKAEHWGIFGDNGNTRPDVDYPVATCSQSICGWKVEFDITVRYTIRYNVDSVTMSPGDISIHELQHVAYIDADLRAFFQPLADLEYRRYTTEEECARTASEAMAALGGGPALGDFLTGNSKHLLLDPLDPSEWMRYLGSNRRH